MCLRVCSTPLVVDSLNGLSQDFAVRSRTGAPQASLSWVLGLPAQEENNDDVTPESHELDIDLLDGLV